MENTMKAILINVKTQKIKEVEHDDTLTNIYNHIDCSRFDVVRIDNINGIYVDDEGFCKDNLLFDYRGEYGNMMLAGSGLILGVDSEGNSISPTLTVEDVKDRVTWLSTLDE